MLDRARLRVCLAAACGLLLAAPLSAAATTLTAADVGSSFPITFDGNVEGSAVDGLSAEAMFTLTSFGSTTTFDILLTNTSGGDITGSGVTSLGFDTDPSLVGASTSGSFDVSVLNGSYPNNFGAIDVCFKTGQANNCNGGQGGPDIGESEAFSISLEFSGDPGTLTLSNFGVRYQRIDGVGFDGDSGTGSGTPGNPIPEPSAALVFAAGLLVARGAARRR